MTTIVASFKERVMLSDSRTTDEDAGNTQDRAHRRVAVRRRWRLRGH